jgi:endonuclease/exonuclease/phosphatase family metal-dependent hydrolase
MKFISVNIERRKHLARIKKLLEAEQPDVLCLQEVMEIDVAALAAAGGFAHHAFCTMGQVNMPNENTAGHMGVAILSKQPQTNASQHYYYGGGRPSTVFDLENKLATQRYMLLVATVAGKRFATTHMLVTPRGSVTPEQTEALAALIKLLEMLNPDVLSGDFNAPRGRATFDKLASIYTDNIPPEYTSSIDPTLHRAAPIDFVVDGLFTKPPFAAHNVRLIEGVSDHKAIIAEL